MKKQSSKWADISLGFASDVIVVVHRFIKAALEAICSDNEVRLALINTLFDELVLRYRKAIENTKFLLEVESSETPMTMNHCLNDNLQKSRQGRAVSGLKKSAFHNGSRGMVVRLDTATQTVSMSNKENIILEIHDILKAYYKVSLKTFIDSVCKQAAMHYLLSPDIGPLALFSPMFVSQLSSIQLGEIAGEAPQQKRVRARLKKEISSLTDAMKILARA